jgi:NAD(P)-dependent dehydrogenase (short-subunit alcohol dehydrogenase family)
MTTATATDEGEVAIDLRGRTAVVTGASSGIGAETARVMAACGARVIAIARDEQRLGATVADCGPSAVAVRADVSRPNSHADIVRQAMESGGGRIDVLAMPAGHFISGAIQDTDVDRFDELWAVHVRAPYELLRAALPHLGDGASVIFYSSTAARSGFAPYAAYSAVKGAVEAMARALAVELAPRVRVNVIAPGFTETPMMTRQFDEAAELRDAIVARTPLGFMGGPEHVAHLAAFLASDLGAYIHGQSMVVDGGWTAQAWQQA